MYLQKQMSFSILNIQGHLILKVWFLDILLLKNIFAGKKI